MRARKTREQRVTKIEVDLQEKGISLSLAIVKSSCSRALKWLRNSARAFHRSAVSNLSDYPDHD